MIDDGRGWKRHVDHLIMQDLGDHQNTDTDVQVPALVPPNSSMESESNTQPENRKNPPTGEVPRVSTPPSVGEQTPIRRSGRVRKAPDRLIEKL